MKKAKDFQSETAKRIIKIFSEGKQKRVLLSDEVGLGKTIVARTVVDMAKSLPGIWDDGVYWVVYVCSNQNIIRQNTRNLGFSQKEIMELSDCRLSMQHLILQERILRLKDGEGVSPKQLIPLTPATSFRKAGGWGNASERALMYVILREMSEFKGPYKDKLSSLLKTSRLSTSAWQWEVQRYSRRVDKCGEQYLNDMYLRLRENKEFQECLPRLMDLDSYESQTMPYECISKLRVAFSRISLKRLDPDLVIMDEFQRFSDLLNIDDDNEESMVAKEFFSNEHPYILLMSATPYKPFTTLEELNSNNFDEQYEDFLKLTSFLYNNETSGDNSFNVIWEDFSTKLSHISTDTFDILIASKNRAEDKMYEVMSRTERFSESLIKEVILDDMEISQADVLSYCQMQDLLSKAKDQLQRRKNKGVNPSYNIPIEYVKSSPYLLSFMQNYQEAKTIKAAFFGKDVPIVKNSRSQKLLLKGNHIYKYQRVNPQNARLQALENILFNNHQERLLWVPPSHPYYLVPKNNVFAQNKDFSKLLVFSAWEMVPRMIAIMLSYESERRNINEAYSGLTYTTKSKIGVNRLEREDSELLTYASSYLANMYDPKKFFMKPLEDIIDEIEHLIQKDIDELNLRVLNDTSAKELLNLLKHLEKEDSNEIRGIPVRAARTLALMAISSPSICLLRILNNSKLPNDVDSDYTREMASEMASNFVALFNRRESSAIVELTITGNLVYYEKVLSYCALGNMQSMLDEYCHMIDEESSAQEIIEKINTSFISATPYQIDTTESYCKTEESKFRMRRSFAFDYAKIVSEKNVPHFGTLQQAFNSPFRPFVLSTTSVGQEGLDFHQYARKIVHWNLPSNPVNMEQREGRINRYKCLAIRRNVAKFFGDKFSWKEMFDEADRVWRKESDNDYSQMVPNWCLPKEIINAYKDELEYIERIVPLYPLSVDYMRYNHLMDVLSLYRLTMGQPRQEELLHLLEGKVEKEKMKELLFDLSPYNHKLREEKE